MNGRGCSALSEKWQRLIPLNGFACLFPSIAAAVVLFGCTDAPPQPYNEPLAKRCDELLAIFNKYGVRRSEGSGGPDIIYLGAGLDCSKGRYTQGIKAMEDLLQRNKIPYPPAVAQGQEPTLPGGRLGHLR